jgi:F0F1-type ATP synthase membrane subunit b/b'
MKIRLLYTIAAVVSVLLCPLGAFAAEGSEATSSWTALIFYAINFGLFLWVIRRFGGAQITAFFNSRAKAIRETASRSETALKDAQGLARHAAELAAGLEAEKSRLAADLAAETAFQIKRLDELAREAAERIKRDSAISVSAARDAGQRRLREALASATARFALELVKRDFQLADQTRLLDRFVAKLSEEARR